MLCVISSQKWPSANAGREPTRKCLARGRGKPKLSEVSQLLCPLISQLFELSSFIPAFFAYEIER
jgi:hypothetical protein